tara:strand:+ start:5784 stop:6140 length:357 start_codon:yes stop_codon:yes gene_type:complete
MKKWKPIVYENSIIPVWLSKIAPIDIWAVSFFIFVFCRGKISEATRTHETIHFQQQLELLFIFQWILYGVFWLMGLIKYKSAKEAYYRNPFEQEAYTNELNTNYLENRNRFSWWKYKV